ncbi:MAG: site-specific DNA-methyltransferase, partial [Actinomycetota bacterium]|nr:site-specific DNA-methyltransferase [Actinomycetota bacterium]
FLPIAAQLQRLLKPSGSFILNIKEGCQAGERSTYVLELILALKAEGWLWTEEYIWHKKHCFPGKWPNRFRDAWERLLQFNLTRDFAMYQDSVRVPARGSTLVRGRQLGSADQLRVVSGSGSGLSRRLASCHRQGATGFTGRSLVYPTNVLYLAVETRNRHHSAVFPESLPDWFIRLFTQPGDVVLDPFMGSGTTNAVANRLGRHSIGVDTMPQYVERATERVAAVQVTQPTASQADRP